MNSVGAKEKWVTIGNSTHAFFRFFEYSSYRSQARRRNNVKGGDTSDVPIETGPGQQISTHFSYISTYNEKNIPQKL